MNAACAPPAVVDHDGRAYLLLDLVRYLPAAYVAEARAAVPRTGQAFWDEVTRRWPDAADKAAAEADQEWRAERGWH